MRRAILPATLLAIVASLALACSSSSSSSPPPCNEDPWECGSGQTCWPQNTTSFACLNSGAGTAGSACEDSPGVATCGDGLECFQTSETASGICSPYCDNTSTSHACPSGMLCEMDLVGATTVQICIATGSAADGG
jgi:hypothetical protein